MMNYAILEPSDWISKRKAVVFISIAQMARCGNQNLDFKKYCVQSHNICEYSLKDSCTLGLDLL